MILLWYTKKKDNFGYISEIIKEGILNTEIFNLLKKHGLDHVFKIRNTEGFFLKEVRRGELIIDFADQLSHVVLLVKGTVKIYPLTGDGETKIIDFVSGFEMLGDLELIVGENAYNTVEAMTDCKLVYIDVRVFKKMLQGNDEMYMFMCKTIAHKLKGSTKRYIMMTTYPAKKRLYYFMKKLREDNGEVVIDSYEMASVLGITDRYLRALLTEFEKEGIIINLQGRRKKRFSVVGENKKYDISI